MHLVVLANRMLSMPIMSCATLRSRSSTKYPFLLNPTVDGALKSFSVTPPREVEDFLISRMFQIRTKSFNCTCMTGKKPNQLSTKSINTPVNSDTKPF